jgi:hypothetical protein
MGKSDPILGRKSNIAMRGGFIVSKINEYAATWPAIRCPSRGAKIKIVCDSLPAIHEHVR